jgi:peptidoglycan/LPS O-acetylase OafA/YrhL
MLFLLPYLVLPIILALFMRACALQRWRFILYLLCAVLLLLWPSLWWNMHTNSDPRPDDPRDDEGMFSFTCAMTLLPIAMLIQRASNKFLTRKKAS